MSVDAPKLKDPMQKAGRDVCESGVGVNEEADDDPEECSRGRWSEE